MATIHRRYSLNKGILEGERKLNVKTNELAAARRADYESFRNATQSDQDQLLSCTILTPSGKRGRDRLRRWKELLRNCIKRE
jgi:hypothetical protein